MRIRIQLLALTALCALAGPAWATTPPSYYPWELLGAAVDSAVKGAWIAHLKTSTGAARDVWFQAFDNGGLSRSWSDRPGVEPGDRWENVNSGRGFSDSICGGYVKSLQTTFSCEIASDAPTTMPYVYSSPVGGKTSSFIRSPLSANMN